ISDNERIIASYRIFDIAKNNADAQKRAVGTILATYKKNSGAVSGEALRYVGEILFKQAAPNVPAYNKFKLKGGTVDNLLASIQAKTQALEKLKAAFGPVLTSKDAHWGVAT